MPVLCFSKPDGVGHASVKRCPCSKGGLQLHGSLCQPLRFDSDHWCSSPRCGFTAEWASCAEHGRALTHWILSWFLREAKWKPCWHNLVCTDLSSQEIAVSKPCHTFISLFSSLMCLNPWRWACGTIFLLELAATSGSKDASSWQRVLRRFST